MTAPLRLAHDVIPARSGHADAPVVVFLGSLGSTRQMWQPQVAALSGGATVVTIDHRGHGDSPVAPGPYAVAELAADVLALLDDLDASAVHLVGLSLGGALAQWIAVHRPDRVLTLTLLCTAARFGEPAGWWERAAAVRADGTESIADAVVSRWFTPALAERDPELVARSRAMVAGTSDEGYAGCCEALAEWDSRTDLGRITAPTLVIAGAQDPATGPETMRTLAEGIVGARMVTVDPGAHLANVEQAGRVTQLIRDHIARSSGYDAGRAAASAAGDATRRAVLGDAHVDRSTAAITTFTAPFQDFITRTAWGDVWTRPGLSHEQRRLLTIAILTAVGNEHELDMHLRSAFRAGIDPGTVAEVLLHTAVYAGVPNSNQGFALGRAALADLEADAGA
ncbi:bifunctional 3-oxoadipate enol-lactonase/4-carboxymuconolactone decarboxylase PcaDC [Tsukamurella spumae]|uniref:3-oxoadipate enol-lactonase n=1 Tax=Tsukamurella spumae TaxID=44753 RepID=A0A846WZP9_9ACTN|nr:3-oxoadipate enol-lactonase [Tsukamurella spumae]NKY17826.1 3-oxoadipate enol-lactonase [Tsukamurella spumae]